MADSLLISSDDFDDEAILAVDLAALPSRGVQTTITGGRLPSLPSSQSDSGRPRPSGTPVNIAVPKTHHKLNTANLGTYIYPTNLPQRDYQRNIVHKALFQNVLCALPTGLGKTFIASTVMLNWYRWTVDAKVVFMAPTRPLVSQQIEACLGITGMPRHDASVLIGGGMQPKARAAQWESKRIFFATPQTVENDLKKGIADPKSIACLVVDEAHRATGNHSYVEVVKFISRFNKSFRILALTATPSGNVEGVQEVISNMHISRAEIRTEESMDIRRYVHKRASEKIKTEPSDEENHIMQLLSSAVAPLLGEVNGAKAYHAKSVAQITQFGVLKALQSYNASPAARANSPIVFKIKAIMSILLKIGHALHLLKIHGIGPFYECLSNLKSEAYGVKPKKTDAKGAKGAPKKAPKTKKPGKYIGQLLNNESFVECMDYCEKLMFDPTTGARREDFIGHPKLSHLTEIVSDFFLSASDDSRVIIFAEYRESAAEILRVLQVQCPLAARPHLFIGQAKTGAGEPGGSGSKSGMSQKEQQRVVADFKSGVVNTLIATSIGEEGLDIGQVDLIICYDQSKSPIRGLQRMGRTGRKRQGTVYMLMTSTEENKLEHALFGYKYIQEQINKNERFDYKVPNRIVPAQFTPECDPQKIEIPEENEEALKAKDIVQEVLESSKRGRKAKDVKIQKKFNMPDNVHQGFRTASSLGVGASGDVSNDLIDDMAEEEDEDLDDSDVFDNDDLESALVREQMKRAPPDDAAIDSKRQKTTASDDGDAESDDDILEISSLEFSMGSSSKTTMTANSSPPRSRTVDPEDVLDDLDLLESEDEPFLSKKMMGSSEGVSHEEVSRGNGTRPEASVTGQNEGASESSAKRFEEEPAELTGDGFLSKDEEEIFAAVYATDEAPKDVEYDPIEGVRNKVEAVFIPHSITTTLFTNAIDKMRTLAEQ